jgi:hypothetical protein
MSGKTRGQAAYEAYADSLAEAHGVDRAEAEWPSWDEIPDAGSRAWEAAAAAAIAADDPLADVPPPELNRLLRMLDGTDTGRTAYAGYYASCGGRSLVSGQPIPDWDAQSADIKRAWQGAADFVVGLIADSLAAAAAQWRERAKPEEGL